MTTYRIAVIPGDGIGKEVVPEGIRVLDAVGAKFGIDFAWDHFDWSCETYNATGHMMPEDGIAQAVEPITAAIPATNPTLVTDDNLTALLWSVWNGDLP